MYVLYYTRGEPTSDSGSMSMILLFPHILYYGFAIALSISSETAQKDFLKTKCCLYFWNILAMAACFIGFILMAVTIIR